MWAHTHTYIRTQNRSIAAVKDFRFRIVHIYHSLLGKIHFRNHPISLNYANQAHQREIRIETKHRHYQHNTIQHRQQEYKDSKFKLSTKHNKKQTNTRKSTRAAYNEYWDMCVRADIVEIIRLESI